MERIKHRYFQKLVYVDLVTHYERIVFHDATHMLRWNENAQLITCDSKGEWRLEPTNYICGIRRDTSCGRMRERSLRALGPLGKSGQWDYEVGREKWERDSLKGSQDKPCFLYNISKAQPGWMPVIDMG